MTTLSIRSREKSIIYAGVGTGVLALVSVSGSYLYRKFKKKNRIDDDIKKKSRKSAMKCNRENIIMVGLFSIRKISNLCHALNYPNVGLALYATDVIFGLGYYTYKFYDINNRYILNENFEQSSKLKKHYLFSSVAYGLNIFLRLTNVFITTEAYIDAESIDAGSTENPEPTKTKPYVAVEICKPSEEKGFFGSIFSAAGFD